MGLGVASIKDNTINFTLVLIGVFLLGEGIWLLAVPLPIGLIIEGVALCILGVRNFTGTISRESMQHYELWKTSLN